MLRDAGYAVVGTLAFPDHHCYGPKDVARIEAAMRAGGGEEVVTTEKDAVRFEAVGTLPFAVRAVPVSVEIEPWDTLIAGIDQALSRARESA